MALKTINDLTALTTPASTDLIGVWNVSAGRMRKSTLAQVVTQAGVAAIKASANTFTAAQTITPAGTGACLTINPPAGNGSSAAISISPADNGALRGGVVTVGHNNNASTPAAGTINLVDNTGAARYVWHDATGLVRTHTSAPINANDTAGTVVGAQTSHIDYKDVVGSPMPDEEALAAIVAGAAAVQRFVYKSNAYNGQEFSGIILKGETLHRYGQDADAEHPAGKSLNMVNAIGDLVLAVREINRRLTVLEA